MSISTPTMIRLRELIGMLENADGPSPEIDRQIEQLMRWLPGYPATSSVDHAKRLVKRYYQFGLRQYYSGEWGAYVEVNSHVRKGFAWASHKREPHALAIAALKSHLIEMEDAQ